MTFLIILLAIIILLSIYLVTIYNKFVSLDARIEGSWSDIDVQLKRRYNLIPALVDTVKGYKDYESSTLEKVIKARQQAIDTGGLEETAKATNILSSALGKLFALAEAYPDLKANQTFAKLQDELANIEEDIQNARRYYNAVVRDYNAMLKSFPDVIIANKFSFKKKQYFKIDESNIEQIKEMPKINL